MAKGNESASFAINLEGNAASEAKRTADSMQALKERISAGVNSVREMNSSLKNLRGTSADVIAAKSELRARIDAEKQALSNATLEAIKAQKASGTLGQATKKLADDKAKLASVTADGSDRAKAFSAAIGTAGGPVAALKDKLSRLSDVAGKNGAGGAMSFLVLGVAGAIAGIVALTSAVASSLTSLGRFVVHAADAARSAALMREAAMGGNAQWGKNFGEQVDALSKKVPTSRAEIDKLGASLAKNNIGGQTWVDTLNAVTQASAALGDDAGSKLQEFITRGRQFQRFQLNPQEMIGSGLTFTEVSEALAKSMHIGVDKAKAALFEGRVKLADGAKALRDAIEKKFSTLNLRQMLSLDNIAKKLGETFDDLTKGIDLEPLLRGFKEIADIFDLSTVSGQALKQIISVFGNDLIGTFSKSTPLAKKFVYGLIIGALELTISYLKVRNAIRGMFSGDTLKKFDAANLAIRMGRDAAQGIAGAMAFAAAQVGAVVAAVGALSVGVYGVVDAFKSAGKTIGGWVADIRNTDWKATGIAIVDGLIGGLTSGAKRLRDAVLGLGEDVKRTFKETLGIHSPSKVFAEFGKHTTEGYEQGVEASSGRAQGAINAMVATPKSGRDASRGASVPVNVTVEINITAGSDARSIAAEVSSASVLEQITKAVTDALHGAGVPI